MRNSFRTYVGRCLQFFGVRELARRLEQAIRPPKFRADTPETPLAVQRAYDCVLKSGLANQGDYFEFGLFRGYTLWHTQKFVCDSGNQNMRFFGFDSFKGFPEVQGPDAYKGDFSKGQFNASLAWVRDAFTQHGVDWRRTILVPGFFDQTLTDELKSKYSIRCAALVLVDCVLYESTALVLNFLEGLLVEGSVIIFDDWNAFDKQDDYGERRAFGEFLKANPKWKAIELFTYGVYGKAFQLALTHVHSTASHNPNS